MPLSPAAAAKRSGVSRSVISRALKDGSLRGTRKNNGHWSIDEDHLDAWLGRVTHRADEKPAQAAHHPDDIARIAELETVVENLRAELADTSHAEQKSREELAAVTAKLETVEASIDDLKSDRDHWRDQASRLAASHARSRPGVFERIFGRRR